ncbi:Nicotinamidase family protein YcaC [Salmonella enterica subsp. enterica]|uniref:Nicotinamidase family protein YcaC n=1 Tax=Salmonella enterica I TaxID=59201 RepID=A0A379WWD0_SALET|nr:Nicotinamidase family protein YcaC [Salmonella enterica subsp. enterica]
MLLIDHQSGLFQTVGDMPMPELRARAAALAKMATLAKNAGHYHGIRTARSERPAESRRSTLMRHMRSTLRAKVKLTPGITKIFVKAVKATGRKTLIIAGTITSVCMAFPGH